MAERVRLRQICHSRAGDKGDIANVGLVVYDGAHYEWVKRHVTAEAVAKHFEPVAPGPVERHELPRIGALNFVIHNALGGGVSRSLKIDAHGKGFSAILLEMEIEAPPALQQQRPTQATAKTTNEKSCIRLGSGSAAFVERLDASLELAESGKVDYLIFDSQSEKQYVEAAERKTRGGIGYDVLLEAKLRAVLPACVKNGVKIINNGGSADLEGTVRLIEKVCKDFGIKGIKVVYFLPDSILDLIKEVDPMVVETGKPASALGDKLVGAQAYQSAPLIIEGLRRGADIVMTSRAGDATQFMAPMAYEFDWPLDDWNLVAKGLGIGHLMECAAQLSGGYYADPGWKEVPHPEHIGFPIAEVQANGDATITKLPGTGGEVSERTCTEQLLYELHDPANYKHNDGIVDFTTTEFKQVGPDRVSVTGTTGHPKPPTVKIFLGGLEGFVAVGRVCYGGTGAYARAKLAADVIVKRMTSVHGVPESDLRVDFIGVNALYPWETGIDPSLIKEVELRLAIYSEARDKAEELLHEVEKISTNGPAAVSLGLRLDYQAGPDRVVGLYTTFLPQEMVKYDAHEFVVE